MKESRQQASQKLMKQGYQLDQVRRFWNLWGSDFFLAHTVDQLVSTANLILQNQQKICARCAFNTDYQLWEMRLWSRSHPFLFSKVCAFFSNEACSIKQAQIFKADEDRVLNVIYFQPINQHESYYDLKLKKFDAVDDDMLLFDVQSLQDVQYLQKGLQKKLITTLAEFFESPQSVTRLKQFKLGRREKSLIIEPKVEVDLVHGQLLELQLICLDQPALLAKVSLKLAKMGISIEGAYITTIGAKAEDRLILRHNSHIDSNTAAGLKQIEREILQDIQHNHIQQKQEG